MEEIIQKQEESMPSGAESILETPKLQMFANSLDISSLTQLAIAQQQKRIFELKVPLGSTVFTIQEDYFECMKCPHGDEAKYDPHIRKICCEFPEGRHCPYYLEAHIVKGFAVYDTENHSPSVSDPGEWGCEGLETFTGIDGKWYASLEEAETAMAAM